jgi:hypothetical protein
MTTHLSSAEFPVTSSVKEFNVDGIQYLISNLGDYWPLFLYVLYSNSAVLSR